MGQVAGWVHTRALERTNAQPRTRTRTHTHTHTHTRTRTHTHTHTRTRTCRVLHSHTGLTVAAGAVSLLEVSGHADEFAERLATSIVPWVDSNFRTRGDAARALIGKSFGGCGVGCCMIHPVCAPVFSEYCLGSPSLTWDDSAWFAIAAERRAEFENATVEGSELAAPPHAAAVFACVGGEETTGADTCARLKAALDARRGHVEPVFVDVVPNEDHGSVTYPFVSRAMNFLKTRWERLEAP